MSTQTPSTRTQKILRILGILAWAACFGLIIQGVSTFLSYIVSIQEAKASSNLYRGLDLSALREFSMLHYNLTVLYLVLVAFMKASIAWMLAKSLDTVNAQSPFSEKMARMLERISLVLLCLGIISFVHNIHSTWLWKVSNLDIERGPLPEYLFTALLVYAVSQVYKRGVEIQSENELTV